MMLSNYHFYLQLMQMVAAVLYMSVSDDIFSTANCGSNIQFSSAFDGDVDNVAN